MSELTKQIAILRDKQVQQQSVSIGKPSLFLSPKDAAKIDIEIIYNSAIEGINVLSQYDDRLKRYLDNILSKSSITYQRELKTIEENNLIDSQISSLLSHLSLFINEISSHKILEYLIRRYLIHDLNSNELLQCSIVAHDNKIFSKILHLCSIKGTYWEFLNGAKENESTITRSTIVKQLRKNITLIESLCTIVNRAVGLGSYNQLSKIVTNGCNRIMSFFTACFMELSSNTSINDSIARQLFPLLVKGIQCHESISLGIDHVKIQFRRSCCMILLQISIKTILTKSLKDIIVKYLIQSFHICYNDEIIYNRNKLIVTSEILTTIVILSQLQQLSLTNEVFHLLFNKINEIKKNNQQFDFPIIQILDDLKLTINVSDFIKVISESLVEIILTSTNTDLSKYTNLAIFLINKQYMTTGHLTAVLANLLNKLIDRYNSINSADSELPADISNLLNILHSIANRYPTVFNNTITNVSNTTNNKVIRDILIHIFISNQSTEKSNSLLLTIALNSPIESVYVQALNTYKILIIDESIDNTTNNYMIELSDNVLNYLINSNDLTTLTIIYSNEIIDKLIRYMDNNLLISHILDSLSKWIDVSNHSTTRGYEVIKLILNAINTNETLYQLFITLSNDQNQLYYVNLYIYLIHFLYINQSNDHIELTNCLIDIQILSSQILSKNDLFIDKTNDYDEYITKNIPKHILKSLSSDLLYQVFESLVNVFIYQINNRVYTYIHTFTNFLNKVVSKITNKLSNGIISKIIDGCINIIQSIIKSFKNQIVVENLLNQIILLLKSYDELVDSDITHFDDYISKIYSYTDNYKDKKIKLLIHLLSNNLSDCLIKSIGLALTNWYNQSTIIDLLISLLYNNINIYINNEILFQINIFYILHSYIDKYFINNISIIQINQFVSLYPLVIYSTSHTNKDLRSIGLSVTNKLSQLVVFNHLNINLSNYIKSNNLNKLKSTSLNQLIDFYILLSKQSSNILIDNSITNKTIQSYMDQSILSFIFTLLTFFSDHYCVFIIIHMNMLNDKIVSYNDSYLYVIAIIKHVIQQNNLSNDLLSCLINQLTITSNTSIDKQEEIISLIVELIKYSNSQINIYNFILQYIKSNSVYIVDNIRDQFVQLLVNEIITSNQLTNYTTITKCIYELVDHIKYIQLIININIDNFMNIYNNLSNNIVINVTIDEDDQIVGLSQPIVKLTNVLELSSSIYRNKSIKFNVIDINIYIDLTNKLFQLLTILTNNQFIHILTIEYTYLTIFDMISSYLTNLPADYTTTNTSIDFNKQLNILMKCLHNSKNIQYQSTILSTIKQFMRLSPQLEFQIIESLGSYLYNYMNNNLSVQLNQSNIIEQVLLTIDNQISNNSIYETVNNNNNYNNSFKILQALYYNISHLSNELILIIINISIRIYSSNILSNLLSILLTHSIVIFNSSNELNNELTDASTNSSLILLSKATQKKAKRLLKSSRSEELYEISIKSLLNHSSNVIIHTVIDIVTSCHQLINHYIINNNLDSKGEIDFERYTLIANYLNNLYDDKSLQVHATIIPYVIINIEFIIDVLADNRFHSSIYLSINNKSINLQEQFLELCEVLFQFLALSIYLQSYLSNDQTNYLSIRLGNETITMNYKSIGILIYNHCITILTTIQHLLDTPTFIIILEELLNHSNQLIRSKAIELLSNRLEQLSTVNESTYKLELWLYIDLSKTLYQTFKTILQPINQSIDLSTHQLAQCQSILLCLDILGKYLPIESTDSISSFEILQELVSYSVKISDIINKINSFNDSKSNSLLKLLGSLYLSCGTYINIVGSLSLSVLSHIIKCMMSVLSNSKLVGFLSNDLKSLTSDQRVVILLLRSMISSKSTIVKSMNNFIHPFIHVSLQHILPLYNDDNSINEIELLAQDIDNYLNVLSMSIPIRLLIQTILKTNCQELLSINTRITIKYINFLTIVINNMDRSTVTMYISNLCSISLLLLDYRRVYGDQSIQQNQIDNQIVILIESFCLKLTENELKSYISKLYDWKDLTITSDDLSYKTISRSVVFYHLVSHLSNKLRHLFITVQSFIWTNQIELLNDYIKIVNTNSSKKKRKRDDKTLQEYIHESFVRSKYIVDSLNSLFLYDTTSFIDEVKFEEIMPVVVSLIGTISVFISNEDYQQFCDYYIIPSIISLARAINTDVQWKPLNYKILLFTRDSKKSIKLIALKTLQKLFHEVGEEYLLLLPECLPFLSELLEDDDQEIVEFTSTVIKSIEELSGEELDNYLK